MTSLPFLSTQFRLIENVFSLTNAGPTEVMVQNANRFAFILCAVTGGQINLARSTAFFPDGSLTLANAANASVQDLVLTFTDVGALVQEMWFAQSKGPADKLGVHEIIYVPTV